MLKFKPPRSELNGDANMAFQLRFQSFCASVKQCTSHPVIPRIQIQAINEANLFAAFQIIPSLKNQTNPSRNAWCLVRPKTIKIHQKWHGESTSLVPLWVENRSPASPGFTTSQFWGVQKSKFGKPRSSVIWESKLKRQKLKLLCEKLSGDIAW